MNKVILVSIDTYSKPKNNSNDYKPYSKQQNSSKSIDTYSKPKNNSNDYKPYSKQQNSNS